METGRSQPENADGSDDTKPDGESGDGQSDTREWIRRTYPKLHQIALSQMNLERKGHTLSATSLIHEVFLRLQSGQHSAWINERQFLAIAASEMRRVLIDAARRKKSLKRGGGQNRLSLAEHDPGDVLAQNVIDLNEGVEELEKIAPEKAELVRLRYFLGFTEIEAAEAMGISRATASRYWTFARAWLLDFLS